MKDLIELPSGIWINLNTVNQIGANGVTAGQKNCPVIYDGGNVEYLDARDSVALGQALKTVESVTEEDYSVL